MKYWDTKTLHKIRRGYYSAIYFQRTREILLKERHLNLVTMQVFQRNENALLCGMNEVRELLRQGIGFWKNNRWISKRDMCAVEARNDGDFIQAGEPVLHVTGPYAYFAHLESLYLGILTRRTLVATNVRRAVKAAAGKPIFFFSDRFDYFMNQEGDGYSAHVGGAHAVCTPAHAFQWKGSPVGTMPHALIAINDGDTIAAAKQFVAHFPKIPLIVLVDYDNDCVRTSLAVSRSLKDALWGVRIDTSSEMGGVTSKLVRTVRHALNSEGYIGVKIVVSGGFTPEKIMLFENENTPVNAYGVGSFFVKGSNDFTADIVMVNGKPQAKKGRIFHEIL